MPDHADQPTPPEVDDADRVVGLIARLHPGSLIRRISLQVLQGRKLDSIQPLTSSLRTPHNRKWRERIASAWALGRTATEGEERDDAARLLMDVVEGSYREKFSGRLKRALGYTAGAAFVLFVLIMSTDGPFLRDELDFIMFYFALCCFSGLFAVPTVFAQEQWNSNIVRSEAAESLGSIGSVEAVGTLASALRDRSEAVRTSAAQALHSLLPLVTPEHYGAMGNETMVSLGLALGHPDGQLVFKILAALENAGTSAAIPYVERANKRGRTHRIRESAERVLIVLQERRLRESDKDRLLRPTNGLHDPALLLRAQTSNPDDSAFLLQPSSESN